MIVIAHNIRSLHNIGSIFRAAAAFGVKEVLLTGYTATPPRKEIAKVALGADTLVPWRHMESLAAAIADCRARGYGVWALETGGEDIAMMSADRGAIALVLGNEVEGLSRDELAQMDGALTIPMHAKRSLNVSVAAGVAMYALADAVVDTKPNV